VEQKELEVGKQVLNRPAQEKVEKQVILEDLMLEDSEIFDLFSIYFIISII
jgi:hypothetical protein